MTHPSDCGTTTPVHDLRVCGNPRCPNVDDTGAVKQLRVAAGRRPAERVFCDRCRRTIRHDLLDLTGLFVQVHGEIVPSMNAAGPKVSGSRDAPIPLNLAVRDLLEHMLSEVSDLADRIRTRWGYTRATDQPTRREREGRAFSLDVNVIATNLDWALTEQLGDVQTADGDTLPAGVDTGRRILKLHNHVRRALGLNRQFKTITMPCPDCDMTGALGYELGTGDVTCRVCGASWPAGHLQVLEGITGHHPVEETA